MYRIVALALRYVSYHEKLYHCSPTYFRNSSWGEGIFHIKGQGGLSHLLEVKKTVVVSLGVFLTVLLRVLCQKIKTGDVAGLSLSAGCQ